MPLPNTVFLLWTCPFLRFLIDEWSRCECEANATKTNIIAINLYPPIYNNNSNKHKMDIQQKLWITAYPFEWNAFLYLHAGFEFERTKDRSFQNNWIVNNLMCTNIRRYMTVTTFFMMPPPNTYLHKLCK